MFSDVPVIKRVLDKLSAHWEQCPCFQWFGRVPSPSNIADAPSRLMPLPMLGDRAKEVFPDVVALLGGSTSQQRTGLRKKLRTRKRG